MKIRLAALAIAAAACVSAHATVFNYSTSLNGANESPATPSIGSGIALVTLDDAAKTMRVRVIFTGLSAGVTAAHIHCCTTLAGSGNAGVATTTPTFTGFPSGVLSGSYDATFDMLAATSYNPAFVTANGGTTASAFAVLAAGIAGGNTYLNIHSTLFPSGEIRGFLTVAAIPEPSTTAMLLAGLAGVGLASRRRRGG